MKKIAIFASGEGTNAERIIRYFSQNDNIKVVLLVSNKEEAGAIIRAKSMNIDAFSLTSSEFSTDIINTLLIRYDIDFIVLAGFLLRISSNILHTFPNKIINIHPSLLPKFGGKGMYGLKVHASVIEAMEKESGITIHYVNEKYDEGNIIFQAKCNVLEDDTPESLAVRVHRLEYEFYPQIIEKLLK